MIKNIVFDIGNVLLKFRPEEYFDEIENAKEVCAYIFNAPAWVEYDLGLKRLDAVIEELVENRPEYEESIRELLSRWTEALQPKTTIKFIELFREKGYPVYLLSNLSLEATEYVASNFSIFDDVDGYILSYREHQAKPDAAIYETLANRYQLNLEESLFVDDLKANIEAAKKLGMTTIHYTDDELVEKELQKILKGTDHDKKGSKC